MGQSLVCQIVHLVFSTKRRVPLITADLQPHLYAYMGSILRSHDSRLLLQGELPTISTSWPRWESNSQFPTWFEKSKPSLPGGRTASFQG